MAGPVAKGILGFIFKRPLETIIVTGAVTGGLSTKLLGAGVRGGGHVTIEALSKISPEAAAFLAEHGKAAAGALVTSTGQVIGEGGVTLGALGVDAAGRTQLGKDILAIRGGARGEVLREVIGDTGIDAQAALDAVSGAPASSGAAAATPGFAPGEGPWGSKAVAARDAAEAAAAPVADAAVAGRSALRSAFKNAVDGLDFAGKIEYYGWKFLGGITGPLGLSSFFNAKALEVLAKNSSEFAALEKNLPAGADPSELLESGPA